MKINSVSYLESQSRAEHLAKNSYSLNPETIRTEIRRAAVGTEELAHSCRGSFAHIEMSKMYSTQLQSIKNTINTYKVRSTIYS